MAEFTTFTRAGLTGFDRTSQDLALEAQSLGWTGRMSTKGHLIMAAPDGVTTMSISRKALHGRSDKNMRANFERWKRQHEIEALNRAVDEASIDSRIESGNAAFLEYVRATNPDKDAAVVLCRLALEDERVREHLRETATLMDSGQITSFGQRIALVWDMPDGEERAWMGRWLIYNPQMKQPVGWGGRGMRTIDDAYEMMREALSVGYAIATEPGDDKPYVCSDCGRRFRLPAHMARHRGSAHPVEPLAFNPPPEDLILPGEQEPDTPPEAAVATERAERDEGGVSPEPATIEDALTVLTAASAAGAFLVDKILRLNEELDQVRGERDRARHTASTLEEALSLVQDQLAAAEERASSNQQAAADLAALREMLLSSR